MKRCLKLKSRSEDEREEIHEDLVVDILTRLDTKTLSNCRWVCKTWYQIISDPIFIAGRRKFMLRNSNLLFVDYWGGGPVYTFSICDHNLIDKEEGDYVFTSIHSTSVKDPLFNPMFLKASCDLLCCIGNDRNVHLCNPRTGVVHTLPACPRFRSVAAYGYVASTREYTVVAYTDAITMVADNEKKLALAKFSFAITNSCSSISSSNWKEIDAECLPFRLEAILINNWRNWRNGFEIVSLDLDKNTYGTTIKSPCGNFATMIDYGGSLCLVDCEVLEVTKELIVWEFSVSDKGWRKKYHVKPEFKHCLYGVLPKSSKEGDLILYGVNKDNRKGKFLILNPETKRFKRIKFPYPNIFGTIKDLPPPIGKKIRHTRTDQVCFLW